MRLATYYLCLIASLLFAAKPLYADSDTLLPTGLDYEKHTSDSDQIIHVLTINPNYFLLKPARAKSFFLNRETVSSIAKRHGAIAAINGGFFKAEEKAQGLPAGILKIANQWHNIAYLQRGAIGWSNRKNFLLFDRVQTRTTLFINHEKMPLKGFNLPNTAKGGMLYNHTYPYAIKPKAGQLLLLIENNKIIQKIEEKYSIYDPNEFIYTLSDKLIEKSKPNSPVEIQIETLPLLETHNYAKWQTAEHIVGGAPLLILNGKRLPFARSEKIPTRFIHKPYARTAIGVLKNGFYVLVVSEYNPSLNSYGMSLLEFSTFLENLGCLHALNLDGGGSSSLYINHDIVNETQAQQDEGLGVVAPRMVSDAILVLPRNATTDYNEGDGN